MKENIFTQKAEGSKLSVSKIETKRNTHMRVGFDNQKYLKMQSEHIMERIAKFDNKLYLEFGGKLTVSSRC